MKDYLMLNLLGVKIITHTMVEKSISKLKKDKAPSPSGVVTEMLKAS